MNAPFKLIISYTNGSGDALPFSTYHAALDAARNVSFSGGRVRRVEVHMPLGGVRAIWDERWSPASQQAGLA